ncbi:GH3 auxin-responsive promoter family protein [Candidatus Woesearchaeota archaeon]|nr:GH3 auxin-responsive promoter family protein [Candidatus Woesearchaeota archaeon]
MWKFTAQIIPLWLYDFLEDKMLNNFDISQWFLRTIDPDFLEIISRRKAVRLFQHCLKTTPAYQKFIKHHKIDFNQITIPDLFDTLVPETNKQNYIKKYSYEDRCQYGRIPKTGNIDESSGTSGNPTDWIRSLREEDIVFKAACFEFNYVFNADKENYIILSAWSSGAWATGIKFCIIAEHLGLVKNTAEDNDDIIKTLQAFGPKYKYIIAGYPPFIRNMIEEAKKKIDLKQFTIHLLTGGEGVIYGWDEYLQQQLKPGARIISSYGASDIDIGIGFETTMSKWIRGLAAKNKALREKLFLNQDRIPMIFQYNPSMHYIRSTINEEQGKQEYHISLLDLDICSPKIKYNLQDEGGVITYHTMIEILREFEPNHVAAFLREHQDDILKLPFLYVVGRSDGTISLDGGNVYPQQIEMAINKNKSLQDKTESFKIAAVFDHKKKVHFNIKIRLKDNIKPSKQLEKEYFITILNNLLEINGDYKQSYTHNQTLKPEIKLYSYHHLEFIEKKIKNIYLA